MSSIMTNASAMTALQSLSATNKSLETTQNRISTGYRVSEAKDNAAYWSIATTMRSDNKALSVVQDALGLGASKVDTAYTAMNKVMERVDEIKVKLVAAVGSSADNKDKIQSEIAALQIQLKSFAEFGELLRHQLAVGRFDRRGGQPRGRHPRRRRDRLLVHPRRLRQRRPVQDQDQRPGDQALRLGGHHRRDARHHRRPAPRHHRRARGHRCRRRRRHDRRARRLLGLDAHRRRLHRCADHPDDHGRRPDA